jgi:hypothetical protein
MTITAADLANINDSLAVVLDKQRTKNFYTEGTDAFLAYAEDEQDNSNGGRAFSVMVVSQGDIASNSSFVEAGGNAVNDEMLISPTTEYWRAQWTFDAMLAANTKGTDAAYDLAKEKISMAQADCKRRFGMGLGGKGWGSLAGIQARTTGASGTITLGMPDGTSAAAVPELARRFRVGDKLYSADLEDAGAMRGTQVTPTTSDAVAIITAINYETGVLTCDTVPASFAVGDYVGRQGNRWFNTTTNASRRLPTGIEAWLSPEVSTGSLGGISLSGRPDLQPIRFSASGKSLKNGLIEADSFHYSQEKPREGLAVFTTIENLRGLAKGHEALKVVEVTRAEKGNPQGKPVVISVSQFMLEGMGGVPIPVLATNFCRPATGFFGPFMSKEYGFKLRYSGSKLINVLDTDGQVFRDVHGGVTDSYGMQVPGFEAKGYVRAALICRHPGNYMVITDLAE